MARTGRSAAASMVLGVLVVAGTAGGTAVAGCAHHAGPAAPPAPGTGLTTPTPATSTPGAPPTGAPPTGAPPTGAPSPGTPSPGTPSLGAPSLGAPSPGCTGDPGATRLVLTEADSGSRRCLSPAGTVELYLHGTATDRWSPVELSGTGLRVAPSGKGALAIGVTAGFFAGTGPGEARLTAVRPPCAAADLTAPACDGTHLIRITVVLR